MLHPENNLVAFSIFEGQGGTIPPEPLELCMAVHKRGLGGGWLLRVEMPPSCERRMRFLLCLISKKSNNPMDVLCSFL